MQYKEPKPWTCLTCANQWTAHMTFLQARLHKRWMKDHKIVSVAGIP